MAICASDCPRRVATSLRALICRSRFFGNRIFFAENHGGFVGPGAFRDAFQVLVGKHTLRQR